MQDHWAAWVKSAAAGGPGVLCLARAGNARQALAHDPLDPGTRIGKPGHLVCSHDRTRAYQADGLDAPASQYCGTCGHPPHPQLGRAGGPSSLKAYADGFTRELAAVSAERERDA